MLQAVRGEVPRKLIEARRVTFHEGTEVGEVVQLRRVRIWRRVAQGPVRNVEVTCQLNGSRIPLRSLPTAPRS